MQKEHRHPTGTKERRHPAGIKDRGLPVRTKATSLQWFAPFCILLFTMSLIACRQDMHDQPRYEPYEKSVFFGDTRSVRPVLEGTVPRGHFRENTLMYTGKTNDGGFSENFPMKVDEKMLQRGRERYDVFCAPCHDRLGTGQGMIVRRGYRRPPSMHIDRLRAAAPGYFFDVMTNGFGAMPRYAVQLVPQDRWAIAAYIRVLQYSQRATIKDVPVSAREKLNTKTPSHQDQQH